MIVGVPKEVKNNEYRVSLVPSGVEALVESGHEVLIESEAGSGTSIDDSEYVEAGAKIVSAPEEIFGRADMVMKVKEPLPTEYPLIRKGQILFTYFHFAANEELTRAMIEREATCIAYETIQLPDGTLPLLTPMSEVAGRMAVQEGAKYLERPMEGRGILLSGVPGVAPANVVILGGGVVGANAAKIAAGFGAIEIFKRRDACQRHYDLFEPTEHQKPASNGGFGDRRRVAQRGKSPDASDARDVEVDETRGSGGGCCGRSGRLFRDDACYNSQRSDLYSRRRRALLCREYAWRGRGHFHFCADERNAFLCPTNREQGVETRSEREQGVALGSEHCGRQGDSFGCRRAVKYSIRGSGRASQLSDLV